jgi:hypothetical protein
VREDENASIKSSFKTLLKAKLLAESRLEKETIVFSQMEESWALTEEALKNTIADLRQKENADKSENIVAESSSYDEQAGPTQKHIDIESMNAKLFKVFLKFLILNSLRVKMKLFQCHITINQSLSQKKLKT